MPNYNNEQMSKKEAKKRRQRIIAGEKRDAKKAIIERKITSHDVHAMRMKQPQKSHTPKKCV